MRIIISVLVFSVLLSGCVNGRFHKESITGGACPGTVDGYTYTLVTYGSGKILVIPLSKIRPNTEWRFYLYPLDKLGGSTAYGDSKVTIDGKAIGDQVIPPGETKLDDYALPTPTPATGDGWLFAEGTFNLATPASSRYKDKRYITACVDADVVVDQEWHYMVRIEDVGEVDPRGKVE